jgi:RNA polymerase sigma-70 factor (ECF subfamily)
VDAASSQPGDLALSLESADAILSASEPEAEAADRKLEKLPDALIAELWRVADGASCGLTQAEFGAALVAVGRKWNHGLPAQTHGSDAQREGFYRSLKLADFALAQACALGKEIAWQRFLHLYRASVTQAAIAITRSQTLGSELADSLYSELFGLKEQDGRRISPLASYSGRGSLIGWLRTTLAQRHCDHHRRTHREEPLETIDLPAPAPMATPQAEELQLLSGAVARTLKTLEAEDRFLLSSYYLDRRTLLDIAHLLKVHEATISRRLKRLAETLHKELLIQLKGAGLSERKAQEALGADPRDIEINMRNLLQNSQSGAFQEQNDSNQEQR